MTPGGDGVAHAQAAPALLCSLGLQDRVGAFRQRRAGHDSHRLARLEPPWKGLTGQRLTGDGKLHRIVGARAERLLSLQRVAVHGCAIESGNGNGGNNITRQDASGCLLHGDHFRGQRPQSLFQDCKNLLHLGPVAKAAHAHVEERRDVILSHWSFRQSAHVARLS